MSEEETMRLVAQVVDKFSGPLRDMQKQMHAFMDASKTAHAAGVGNTKAHVKAYGELDRITRDVAERTRSVLVPALATVGITTLSVAGAITALGAAVTGFGTKMRALTYLSRDVKMSIDKLRELDEVSKRIGSSPEAMNAGLEAFARDMEQLGRWRGASAEFFASQHNMTVRALGDQLRALKGNNEAQLQAVLDFLPRIQDVQQRMYLLGALGLPRELAHSTGKEYADMVAHIRSQMSTLDAQARKNGITYAAAMDDMRFATEQLSESVGEVLGPSFAKLELTIAGFVTDHREDIVAFFKEINDWADKPGNWKRLGDSFRTIGEVVGGLVALKLASWVAGVTRAFAGLFALAAPSWLLLLLAPLATAGGILALNKALGFEAPENFADRFRPRGRPGPSGKGPGDAEPGGFGFAHRFDPHRAAPAVAAPDAPGHRATFDERWGGAAAPAPAAVGIGGGAWLRHAGRHRSSGGPADLGAPSSGSPDVNAAILAGAAAAGVDPADFTAMASIESGLHPGSNRDRHTQYKGLFQIGRSEWARTGAGGDIYNASDNAMAASRLMRENAAGFRKHFNRDPTPGELYLMHQQGLGFYTRGAMTNIRGNPYPGMHGPQTHDSFEAGWTNELSRRAARFRQHEAAPAAAPPGPIPYLDLLKQGKQSGLLGGTVTGDASLSIDLNGFPRGTKTATRFGGLFKEVTLNRGSAMPMANQDG